MVGAQPPSFLIQTGGECPRVLCSARSPAADADFTGWCQGIDKLLANVTSEMGQIACVGPHHIHEFWWGLYFVCSEGGWQAALGFAKNRTLCISTETQKNKLNEDRNSKRLKNFLFIPAWIGSNPQCSELNLTHKSAMLKMEYAGLILDCFVNSSLGLLISWKARKVING